MRRVFAAGVRSRRRRTERHHPHQTGHSFASHRVSLPTQGARHLPGAVPRGLQILLVDPAHQHQVFPRLAPRSVVQAAAADAE